MVSLLRLLLIGGFVRPCTRGTLQLDNLCRLMCATLSWRVDPPLGVTATTSLIFKSERASELGQQSSAVHVDPSPAYQNPRSNIRVIVFSYLNERRGLDFLQNAISRRVDILHAYYLTIITKQPPMYIRSRTRVYDERTTTECFGALSMPFETR